jgi:hypothetical protein
MAPPTPPPNRDDSEDRNAAMRRHRQEIQRNLASRGIQSESLSQGLPPPSVMRDMDHLPALEAQTEQLRPTNRAQDLPLEALDAEHEDRLMWVLDTAPILPYLHPPGTTVGPAINADGASNQQPSHALQNNATLAQVVQSPRSAAGSQFTPPQETQQPNQAPTHMPTLRSQPEFYMTGVTAIDTTSQPLPDNAECTICLEPLSDDVVKFIACGHMFHTVCVQSWFDQSALRTGRKRGTCPNCRHELYEPDPRYGHGHGHGPVASPRFVDPRHRHAAPPHTTEPLTVTAAPHRTIESRRATATLTSRQRDPPPPDTPRVPSDQEREARRVQFVADYDARLRAREQQEQQTANARPSVRITRRPHGTPRVWGELMRGYQNPRLDSFERARDMDDTPPTVQSDPPNAAPPRPQPLSQEEVIALLQVRARDHRADLAQESHVRQGASRAMTQATQRATASPRQSETGDRQEDPAELNEHTNADHIPEVVGRPTFMPEHATAPTSTSNDNSAQAHESRATLAARAIAERRPLTEVMGLNNRDVDVGRPAQVHAAPSPFAHLALVPPQDHYLSPEDARRLVSIRSLPVARPDLASRSTNQLRDEQVMLLDRLRAVQTQIGRNLVAAGATAERETTNAQQLNFEQMNLQHDLQTGRARAAQEHASRDDTSSRRPPPIAIPRLADPSVSDLRSSREFPDPRALGMGTTIWSTDYVAPPRDTWGGLIPSGVTNGTHEALERRAPISPESRGNTPTIPMHNRLAFNDDQPPSPAWSTRSETPAEAQPASGGDQTAAPEDTQPVQHPNRDSTAGRFIQVGSLPLRDAPTGPAVFSQPTLPRVHPSQYTAHRRTQGLPATGIQSHAASVARSEPPTEDDTSSSPPAELS